MKKPLLSLLALSLAACSSVEMINAPTTSSDGGCTVTVWPTRAQAIKRGEIEELCIINGSSAFSFTHTVATAIAKHKSKACDCGASNVYIESRRETGLEVATVTMVAFRFVKPPLK
nr:hypothetical protein [Dechloromonas sp.]